MNRIHSTYSSSSSSFTLVELLIVIGILAILTSAIVLILNPAELLRQSRDTTRMSDLASIHTALSLYLTQSTQPSLGTASTIYISLPDTSPTCINLSLPTLPSGYTYACVSQASSSLMNGSGWLPINLASSSISSLPKLPLDPTNTTSSGLYYTYSTNGTQYELTTTIESAKYAEKSGGDGGGNPIIYELGNNTSLVPFLGGLASWWKFDETSGTTAYDSSGFGNNGTMYSSSTPILLTTQTGCKIGGCITFDGSNDWVVLATTTVMGNGNWTISAWVKTSYGGAGSSGTVLSNSSGGPVSNVFDIRNGKIEYRNYYNTWYSNPGVTTINDDTWHLLTWVNYEGYAMNMYVDGILESSGFFSRTGNGGPVNTIGQYCGVSFLGSIDDMRFYKRSLSGAEIKALYNATK